MNDPIRVRLGDRLEHLEEVFDRFVDRKGAAPRQVRGEIAPLQVLEDDERGAAREGAEIEHARDVLVAQFDRGARLAEEAGDVVLVAERARKHEFESHALIELQVGRSDDDAHPTDAEHALDTVFLSEYFTFLHRRRGS